MMMIMMKITALVMIDSCISIGMKDLYLAGAQKIVSFWPVLIRFF
jgi:hypothetical protein